jgi:nicotinamide-nucleotide amidase
MSPSVEVINTGSELLLGRTANTHLQYLGRQLFKLGLRIQRQVCVPDGPAIGVALAESMPRSWAVIVTGGLGPTTDDITRELTAELLGLELALDETVLATITERFARRNLRMAERNKRQAYVPKGVRVLENPNGTAPGLHIPPRAGLAGGINGMTPHIFLLPGPPRELHPMVETLVLPLLKAALPEGFAAPAFAEFMIIGLGESEVESRVGSQIEALPGIELGYCARPGEVDLRVIGSALAVEAATAIVREKLGAYVASDDGRDLPEIVVHELTARRQKLAVAESCTGGFLAHRITNVPGASAVFVEDFITYANRAKEQTLGIDPAMLAAYGAVSEEVARAMAEHALALTEADYALATTGIAGPGGGSAEKPVGTVFIALARRVDLPLVNKHFFPTQRETFKTLVSQTALDLLRRNFVDAGLSPANG